MSAIIAKAAAAEETRLATARLTRERTTSERARRLIARSRYSAPTVASFTVSACDATDVLSMIGNAT